MTYPSNAKDCASYPVRERYVTGSVRNVTRNVHEAAREHARALRRTKEYARSAWERGKIEMLFGHLKLNLGLKRLRLRSLSGTNDEFLLAATTLNLRRLARNHAAPIGPTPA